MPQLKLTLLGAPQLELNSQPISIPRRKVMALLVYLTVTRQPQRRDKLATLFWPESRQQTARSALRREFSVLRGALGDEWFVSTREEIALSPDMDILVDVDEFRQQGTAYTKHNHSDDEPCTECLVRLTAAAALYQSDFLAGFTLTDCPEFDDWQFFEADGLRRDFADVLSTLVQLNQRQGEYETAITYARRWLALDMMHEPVHRELMRLFAQAGQLAAAIRQYDECVRILDEELGVPPEEETVELFDAIRTRRFPTPNTNVQDADEPLDDQQLGVASHPSNAEDIPQPKHNLPSPPTSFIGREDELATIRQLLSAQADCRLLTLIGPGGIGKTRLAIEAASSVVDSFSDGIYFVELAEITSADATISAIAEALHFPLQGNIKPDLQLASYLKTKQMLLIIDNLEHLLISAELFAHLVTSCPDLKLLVTSREALELQEEWLYPVYGFATPSAEILPAAVAENHAVQLFVQRARRANSSLALTEHDLVAVSTICRLVDGLPLALELAATWVRTLSIEEIAEEVTTDLDFLTTTSRDAPARHSSLRIVLEQTWRLLTQEEQEAFCKLAFFHGGFSRQAAKRVADISVVVLAALVRKSIIGLNQDGRYTILALLRQFATEKRQEDAPLAADLAQKHSRYYGMFLQTQEDDLLGAAHVEALQKIGQELDNIRHGWRWVLPQLGNGQDGDDATYVNLVNRYVEALFQFYDIRSRFQEGYTEFQHALTQLDALQPENEFALHGIEIARGRVCGRLGWFAFQIGQPIEAISLLQRSINTLSAPDAQGERVFALNYLGAVHRHLGDHDEARRWLIESEKICREGNDRFGLTVALNILGQIAFEELEYNEADAYLEESLALKQTIGDQRGITFSLLYLGRLAQAQGDYTGATKLLSESIEISKEHGDRRGIAIGLSNLADVEMAVSHPQEAQSLYEESLAIYSSIYNLRGMIAIHIKLGDLALGENDLTTTTRHFEATLEMANDLQVSPQALEALIGHPRDWLAQHA